MEDKEFEAWLEKELAADKNITEDAVCVITMHGAKGLEFRTVFLPALVEGVVPHEKGMEQIEEERRLFYVAMTRTGEKLCLSAVRKRYEKETRPSRFLAEMGLDAERLFGKKEGKES